MRPDQILPSSFLDNLGTDWIAVNHQGTVIGRASTEAAVRRANPEAVAFFSAPDLDSAPDAPAPTSLEDYEEGVWIPAEEAPAEEAPAEEAPAEEAPVVEDRGMVLVDGSAFDHDGDGKVGGGAPKSRKRKPASK